MRLKDNVKHAVEQRKRIQGLSSMQNLKFIRLFAWKLREETQICNGRPTPVNKHCTKLLAQRERCWAMQTTSQHCNGRDRHVRLLQREVALVSGYMIVYSDR